MDSPDPALEVVVALDVVAFYLLSFLEVLGNGHLQYGFLILIYLVGLGICIFHLKYGFVLSLLVNPSSKYLGSLTYQLG